jgi:hypothetical protein
MLPVIGCSSEPQKSVSGTADVLAATTLLATMTVPEKQPASSPAADGHSTGTRFVIHEKGRGYAFIAETDGVTYVDHNGKAHQPFPGIDHLTLSPDGQHVAYSYRNGKRSMVLDGRPAEFYDDVWQPVFSPDSRHIAYIAQERDLSHIVIGQKLSAGVPTFIGNPVFSADSSKVAYVEGAGPGKNARLVVSDLSLKPLATRQCVDKEMLTNLSKTKIAAVAIADDKQRVIVVDFNRPDQMTEGPLYDAILKPVFDSDGITVAYAAQKRTSRYLVFNGKEQRLPDDAEIESIEIHPDHKGVGVILYSQGKFFLLEAFLPKPSGEKKYDEATGIVYSRDGSQHAYAAARGKDVFAVVNGNEGPAYDMIVKPMFSPDGKSVIYRARKDGKRFVVVSDLNGKVIRQHAAYEQVFPPVFTADGRSVAYGVKDGNQLIWKVEKL